jgi:U2 small nuclear ribonucleoprotein A'
MTRLTADLVLRAPSYINPVKERELDLRAKKIPAIENLGTTQDQYDTIDLSDNEIGKLENFPLLPRLRCLLFNNNHISKIAPNLDESLPNLETLILTNNRLVNLQDIDPLADLPSLKTLSLIDNVVSKKPNYRLYVIHKLPNLKLLDFRKIKHKDRAESEKLFGPPVKKAKPKKKKPQQAKTFVPGQGQSNGPSTSTTTPSVPTQTQAPRPAASNDLAFKAAIQSAKTMEEISRIERAIQTGQTIPPPTTTTTTTTSRDVDMTDAPAHT